MTHYYYFYLKCHLFPPPSTWLLFFSTFLDFHVLPHYSFIFLILLMINPCLYFLTDDLFITVRDPPPPKWLIYFLIGFCPLGLVIFIRSIWFIYAHLLKKKKTPDRMWIFHYGSWLCWSLNNASYLWVCLQLQILHGDLCVYFVVEKMGCSLQSFPQCLCRLLINTDRFISAPVGSVAKQQE